MSTDRLTAKLLTADLIQKWPKEWEKSEQTKAALRVFWGGEERKRGRDGTVPLMSLGWSWDRGFMSLRPCGETSHTQGEFARWLQRNLRWQYRKTSRKNGFQSFSLCTERKRQDEMEGSRKRRGQVRVCADHLSSSSQLSPSFIPAFSSPHFVSVCTPHHIPCLYILFFTCQD